MPLPRAATTFAPPVMEARRWLEGVTFSDTLPLIIYCGDYFDLTAPRCDALLDRGALVAMPPDVRPRYVGHTKSLLAPGATKLVVTLEYDQSVVAGPPFAVMSDEVLGYYG